jgi:hypothetical protein
MTICGNTYIYGNIPEVAKKTQNDVPSGIRPASDVPTSILAAHHAIIVEKHIQ